MSFFIAKPSKATRGKQRTKSFKFFIGLLSAFIFLLQVPLSSVKAGAVMNMQEEDIRVFIETVSRLTGKTFIIDPRVRNAKVTVISHHEMDEDEIFALFLSVLNVNNFAAIENDGVYKITQLQIAKTDNSPVVSGEGTNRYKGDRLITTVVKVDNIDVGQLVPVLRTLVPQQGHMAMYKPTNVLVIHDTAANTQRIVSIINQIDRESNEEVEVIGLSHASATEVVRILENLEKQNTQKENPANAPRYVADERTNSILLSADDKNRMRLRALIARLDTQADDAGNTKVIHLHYAKAEELAALLEGVAESIEQEDGKKRQQPRGSDKLYSIKAHEETNSLVVTAPPDIMKSFESVIRQLDIPRAQVHVEAMIVEISDKKVKELGVQWLTKSGLLQFNNSQPTIGQVGATIAGLNQGTEGTSVTTVAPDGTVTTTTTPGQEPDYGSLGDALGSVAGALLGFTDEKNWAVMIKALASDTDSNILSTPSLTTLDNEEATISVGQEIPIVTGSTLGNNNSNPFTTTQRKDVGIKLKITPQINEGDAVRLQIEQEVSSIAGATGVDVVTNKRLINTTVLVKNGGTVVLGGLIDDDIQESSQKVPLLGDIPLLGNLFSSKVTNKVKRNLMVFIRPTIIRDETTMKTLSTTKYNYMRAKQLDWQQRGVSLMPTVDPAVLPEFDETLVLPPSFDEYMDEVEQETSIEENQ